MAVWREEYLAKKIVAKMAGDLTTRLIRHQILWRDSRTSVLGTYYSQEEDEQIKFDSQSIRYLVADVSRDDDDYALDHIFGVAASKNIFFTTPACPLQMRCDAVDG